ncbi:PTS sugar transporter subunit IIA [Treponema sp.]|uniref:PTS sugar transporter subunit IIA n=1 Tax=Treponema sp. TaxID=166 RepID=UPI0025D35ED8|nr:PTS sugar transporter subunit IIA [Treponema sp.]MCR5218791.1 PTS sugar transporter subunit IIA [Treponema sp.]
MVLQQIFSENTIIMDLQSESKDELFHEMVQKIVDANPAVDRKAALDALFSREEKMTTGIVYQVAVPHGVLDNLDKACGAFGISKKGIEYGSIDGNDVHYVFMFLFSADDNSGHLKALKELSLLLQKPEFIGKLSGASSPKEVLSLLSDID